MNMDNSALFSLAAFLGVSGTFLLSSLLRKRRAPLRELKPVRPAYSVTFILGPPGSGKGTQVIPTFLMR